MSSDLNIYKAAMLHQDALYAMFMEFSRDPDVKTKSQAEWDLLWRVFQKGAEAQRTLKAMSVVSSGELIGNSGERKGFCIVRVSKALMEGAAVSGARDAATTVGSLIADAVAKTPYKPCTVVKVELVEPTPW